MDRMAFASRLKLLRTQAGLSQGQLARKAGLNRLTVAKYEQGVREPNWKNVRTRAHALGVSCQEFDDKDPGA